MFKKVNKTIDWIGKLQNNLPRATFVITYKSVYKATSRNFTWPKK